MSPRARMEYPDHLLKIQKSLSKTKDSDPFMVNFAKNFGYVAVVLRQVFPLGLRIKHSLKKWKISSVIT